MAVNLRTIFNSIMINSNSKNIRHPTQLAILLGITGGGVIISALITAVIWLMMVGGTLPTKSQDILQPKYYNVSMVIQAVTTFCIFFLPVYLFAAICYRRPAKFLGFNSRINYKQFFLVLCILIVTFPLAGALGELNKILPIPQNWALKFKTWEAAREAEEAAFIHINSVPRYLLSLFIIALLPGIFEETFFRGGVQNFLTRWFKGPWTAIILTSIIFSLIHLSYYGFIVRFALGVILGLIFYYGGSLWLSILFHFLFNGIQVTALYIANSSGKISQVKDMDKSFPLWWGVVALVLLIYLFVQFKKTSETQLAKYTNEPAQNDFPDWVTDQS
jgi:membrane protease YdiL (CAAX protease family)